MPLITAMPNQVLHNDATQQNSMLDFKQVGVWTNFFPLCETFYTGA